MKEEDFLNVKYYKINKFFLKKVSLWPYRNKYKTFWRTLNFLALLSTVVPQIILTVEEVQRLYKYGSDHHRIEVILENIVGATMFYGILIKYGIAILAEKKMNHIYELMTIDWFETKDPGERNILRKRARLGYALNLFYAVYLFVVGIFFVSLQATIPIFLNYFHPLNETRPMQLCYYAEFFIDQQKYFSYLFLHSVIIIFVSAFLIISCDINYVSCTQHLLALFDIIGYRLSQTYELSENLEKYDSPETRLRIKNNVIHSIHMHQKSIEFAELARSAYDTTYFIITVMYVIGTAVVLVNVTQNFNFNNYVNLVRILTVSLACLVYQLYVNWPGQKVFDTSEKLTIDIYNCNWFKFPIESQFLLKFMLMRCLNPSKLTAGPFIEMNFATVLLILRISLSYFTVVGSIQE